MRTIPSALLTVASLLALLTGCNNAPMPVAPMAPMVTRTVAASVQHPQSIARAVAAPRSTGINIPQLFQAWDRNKDGKLSQTEFSAGYTAWWQQADGYEWTLQAEQNCVSLSPKLFASFDANNDRSINPAEFSTFVHAGDAGYLP